MRINSSGRFAFRNACNIIIEYLFSIFFVKLRLHRCLDHLLHLFQTGKGVRIDLLPTNA